MLPYFRNIGIETDIWLSVLTGGAPGVTISFRVAQAAQRGGKPACFVCKALSALIEKDHCAKQISGTTTAPAAALRAGFLIFIAWAAIVYGLPHLIRN